MHLALVFLLVLAARAAATPIFIDSFDLPDCTTYSSTTCDSFLWTETNIAAAEDSDLTLVKQADGQTQNAENGGDATSKMALSINLSANEAAVYETPKGVTLSEAVLTVGLRLYLPSAPGANKTLVTFNEAGLTTEEGCSIRILATASCTSSATPYACCTGANSGTCDGKMALHYEWPAASGPLLGITTQALQPKGCWKSDDTQTDATCTTAATDCPSGYSCGCSGAAPECDVASTCDASSGRGCYWAGLELTQENLTMGGGGSGRVRCTLRWNGTVVAQGTMLPGATTNKPQPITNVRIGSVVNSTGSFTASVDSVVLDNSTRAGFGWLGFAPPRHDGDVTGTWTKDSCTAATEHKDCLDEFAAQQLNTGSADFLKSAASAAIRKEQYRVYAMTEPPTGVAIPAVFAWWLGRAAVASGVARDLTTRLFVCANLDSVNPPSITGGAGCGTLTYGTAADFAVAADTADKLLYTLIAPTAPGATAWTGPKLARLGMEITTRSTNAGASRLIASAMGAIYTRPDAPAVSMIREGNKGTDDNRRTVAFVGHSNTGGTVGGRCIGGTTPGAPCNQLDYASWDATERDSPTGGCFGDHASVRTCTGRRAEVNSAGYPCGTCTVAGDCENGGTCTLACVGGTVPDGTTCTVVGDCGTGGSCLGVCSTANSECPNTATSTCSGDGNADGIKDGTCAVNDNIPCDVNADCGLLGGTCDTTASCVQSCGAGGTCSNPGGYSGLTAARLATDTSLLCAQGAEGSYSLRTNRWARILDGIEPTCSVLAGRTGQCQCTASADCPGSGTCTSGLCVGGSGCVGFTQGVQCKACSSNSDCGTSGTCVTYGGATYCACQFDKPDVLFVHSGAADVVEPGSSPNCTGPLGIGLDTPVCDEASCAPSTTAQLCTTDTEAQDASRTPPAGAPDARCVGERMDVTGRACLSGNCTAQIALCRQDSDCPFSQTCTQSTTDSDTVYSGYCRCAADANCATGYACVGSFCRKKCGRCSVSTLITCSDNADCGNPPGAQTCNTSLDTHCQAPAGSTALAECTTSIPRVCKGRATCPCSRTTCTTDADCPSYTIANFHDRTFTLTGVCSAGRCSNCGMTMLACPDATAVHARDNWRHYLKGHMVGVDDFKAMQAVVDGLSETDRRPLMIPITEPTHKGKQCVQYTDAGYLGPLSTHLLHDFDHVVDGRSAIARYPIRQMAADDLTGAACNAPIAVHYTGVGSPCVSSGDVSGQEVLSQAVLDYTDSLNTCAIGTCRTTAGGLTYGAACGATADCAGGETCDFHRGLPKPQRYCRNVDGSVTSTSCTTDTECTAPATCQVRPCTCVCTQSSECRAWYSAAYGCYDGSNGTCDAGETCTCKATSGFASACALFGGSYSCDTATAKCLASGVDACPATGDGCNPEG